MIARRSFISGLVALVAAPAIVRAANIMPVRSIKPTWSPEMIDLLARRMREAEQAMIAHLNECLYGDHNVENQFGLADLVGS